MKIIKKLLGKLSEFIEYKGQTERPASFHQGGKITVRGGLRVAWSLGELNGLRFSIQADPSDDMDVTIAIGGPLAMVWVCIPDRNKRFHGIVSRLARTETWWEGVDVIHVRTHSGAIWGSILHSAYQWKATDPWWSDWSFNLLDSLFGSIEREDVETGDEIVEIGLPEGSYTWRIRTFNTILRRPHWPWPWGEQLCTYRAEAVGEQDEIPIPGKGENSWDCGPDAMSAQSGPGGMTEAIGKIYASVLRTRLRRCGSAEYSERPAPPIANSEPSTPETRGTMP